jgi:hypothetical protein
MYVDTVLKDLKRALDNHEISRDKYMEEYDKYVQSKEYELELRKIETIARELIQNA